MFIAVVAVMHRWIEGNGGDSGTAAARLCWVLLHCRERDLDGLFLSSDAMMIDNEIYTHEAVCITNAVLNFFCILAFMNLAVKAELLAVSCYYHVWVSIHTVLLQQIL